MSKKGSSDAVTAALSTLAHARETRERAEQGELAAVNAAREAGASWGRIGEVYGLTKQGAQQRFKHQRRRKASTSSSTPPGTDAGGDLTQMGN